MSSESDAGSEDPVGLLDLAPPSDASPPPSDASQSEPPSDLVLSDSEAELSGSVVDSDGGSSDAIADSDAESGSGSGSGSGDEDDDESSGSSSSESEDDDIEAKESLEELEGAKKSLEDIKREAEQEARELAEAAEMQRLREIEAAAREYKRRVRAMVVGDEHTDRRREAVAAMKGTRVLAITVTEYDSLSRLPGKLANDGARLVDLARNPYVCAFPADRCTHLVDPTLEEMRAALEQLAADVASDNAADLRAAGFGGPEPAAAEAEAAEAGAEAGAGRAEGADGADGESKAGGGAAAEGEQSASEAGSPGGKDVPPRTVSPTRSIQSEGSSVLSSNAPSLGTSTSSNQQPPLVPVGNNVLIYLACRSGKILGGGNKGAWFCPKDADCTKNKKMGQTCLSGKELIRLVAAIPGATGYGPTDYKAVVKALRKDRIGSQGHYKNPETGEAWRPRPSPTPAPAAHKLVVLDCCHLKNVKAPDARTRSRAKKDEKAAQQLVDFRACGYVTTARTPPFPM